MKISCYYDFYYTRNIFAISQLSHSPEGRRRDDQISSVPQSGLTGGQLITGKEALPDKTGPRPLLRPATAMNTIGMPRAETLR